MDENSDEGREALFVVKFLPRGVMKRGVFLNLFFLFILVFLVALPFLVMLAAGLTAESLGCQMSGASAPDGFCGTLYVVLIAVGWTSIGIVPLTVGALLLYLAGVFAFFVISLVLAGLRGQPVSPVAKGMMTVPWLSSCWLAFWLVGFGL